MYDAVATQLAEQHHVITPDFRGFGGSVLGDGEPSLDVMADDVAALLGRLDLDRVLLAGLSMGGYVAMAMLRRHPQRIGAVVLMDTKAAADAPQARENRERMARAPCGRCSRACWARRRSGTGRRSSRWSRAGSRPRIRRAWRGRSEPWRRGRAPSGRLPMPASRASSSWGRRTR